jgi:uncharacterized protein (DUF1501 family)
MRTSRSPHEITTGEADVALTTADGRSLTRREVLGGMGVLAASASVPLLPFGGSPAAAASRTQATPAAPASRRPGQGIVVLVTLYGGNDGINTIVPTQDPVYASVRGAAGIGPTQTLRINDALGFHPSLVGLKALFDQGKVGIVPGVGYPTPNRSHFRSMDIWQSGVPDRVELTGWLGRWHDAVGADPMRMLSIGPSVPRALVGAKSSAAAIPNGSFTLPGGAPLTNAYLESVRTSPAAELGAWAGRITDTGADLLRVSAQVGPILTSGAQGAAAVNLEGGAVDGVAGSVLERQLGEVATLIKAKVPTRVYSVSLGGFDTHANELGTHANLLSIVDRSLSTFLANVAADPMAPDVVVVVYSEFGRRVAPNLSNGTDHGTSGPVLVLGHGVRGGMHADYPSLGDLVDGDLKVTTDFRRIYSTVIEQVLGTDPAAVLGKRYDPLGFL